MVFGKLFGRSISDSEKSNMFSRSMHAATSSGDLMTVQMCLKNGADVNWKAPYEHTALMEAAAWGSVEIVEELLNHGAAVNQNLFLL